jgi:hypothetical protein
MRKFFIIPLLLGATTLFAGTVVYDNGAPNQQSGNEMTEWVQSEDFTLAQTTTITGVNFWTIEFGSGYAGSIWYSIYTDNGGQPSVATPVAGDFSQAADLTRNATGNIVSDIFTEYAFSFNIQPFVALAGQTYWLALHNGALDNTDRAEVYWETTNPNATATGHEFDLTADGGSWFDNGDQHAFQLTVPEPATLALFGAGLIGLGLMRRRQK